MAGVALGALDYHRALQIYLAPDERAAAYRDHTLEKVRGSGSSATRCVSPS
jgi:hypothetical protein